MCNKKMVNLGVLFREAKKGQPIQKTYIKPRRHNNIQSSTKTTRRISGIKGITKVKNRRKGSFSYRYTYSCQGGKKSTIQRRNLKDLYNAMLLKNHHFTVIDKNKAYAFLKSECIDDNEYNFFINRMQVS